MTGHRARAFYTRAACTSSALRGEHDLTGLDDLGEPEQAAEVVHAVEVGFEEPAIARLVRLDSGGGGDHAKFSLNAALSSSPRC